MDIFEAVDGRFSCRAFLDRPVDPAILRELLERASRAASGSNLQPWKVHVVTGEALQALKSEVAGVIAGHDPREGETEYPFHPPGLGDPYKARKEEHGVQLYGALGIAREDKQGRLDQYKRNFALFGAPAALFFTVDRRFGVTQWADVGLFLSTVMYLARGYGLNTCSQQSWARVYRFLGDFLSIPSDQMLYCGLAVGYGDLSHPANSFRSHRASVDDFATFHDTITR